MIRKFVYCLLGLFFMAAPAYPVEVGMKQKLAVLPFMAKNMEAMTITESLSSLLLNSIDSAGYFEILERKKVENIIEVEGLRLEHLTVGDMTRIGSRNGVDFMLSGGITSVGTSLALDIKLLSVRGQKACFSETVRFSESELSLKLRETAQQLVKSARECSSVSADRKDVSSPSDLKASGTSKSIRLNWAHPDAAKLLGFRVVRSNAEDGSYTQVATTTENTWTDDNLNLNETFYYKVQAIGSTGTESGFSASVVGRTSIAPPPPIFLSVRSDIKGAHLQWRSRPGKGKEGGTEEAGYRIYRKTAHDKEFAEVSAVPAESSSFTDSGLRDKTAYTYTMTALNSKKAESEFSASLDTVTPQGLDTLRVEEKKIRHVPLKWTAHIFDAVDGYRIYRAKDKAGEYKKIAEVSGRMTVSYTDTGLEDNMTYWYRITAYNKGHAETDMSEPVSATTRGVPPVVKGLAARSREVRKITLNWDLINSPDDEIKGYRFYRSSDEKGEYKKIGEVDSERKNSFVDDSQPLKDDASYYYKITAYNSAGAESPLSETVSAITKALPKAPAGVKVKSGEVKKISISWDRNQETDVKEYLIHRKRSDEKSFDRIKTLKGDTAYVDTDLKDGVEYAYAIQAVDSDGLESIMSEQVSAKTKPLPQKPAGLKLSEKDGKKALSWDANPEKDIKQYNVYRKAFIGTTLQATVLSTSWVIDELKDKTEFSITAVDETGLESEKSEALAVEKK